MGREIAPLDLPEPEYDPERDMAFWLESTDPLDPTVLRVLYERYGRDVQQLVMWLLAEEKCLDMLEVQHVLRKTFGTALARLEGFRGQESVRTWIMGLALEAVRTEKRQRVFRKANWFFHRRGASQWVEACSGDDHVQEMRYQRVLQLSNKLRIAILLRYGCNLLPAQIALLLGGSEQQIHETLNEARRQLLGDAIATDVDIERVHPDIQLQALAVLDGLSNVSMYREALDAHIDNCASCREVIEPFRKLHAVLPEDLVSRWIFPDLPPLDELLPTDARRILPSGELPGPIKTRLWDILLIGGVLLFVLLVGWNLARTDTHRGKPIFQATPGPTPTPQMLVPGRILQDPLRNQNDTEMASEMVFNWQPQFSADGRWLAYTQIIQKLEGGVLQSVADVRLLDMQTRQIQLVGAQGQSSPALSADGRFIAYQSNTMPDNIVAGIIFSTTYTCHGYADGEKVTCDDVWLFDRQTGKTQLVSQALDGGRNNWHSLLPAISADGQFVAFWSAATNLIEEPSQTCAKTDPANHCWDIYVRDMHTGELQRVPLGRIENRGQTIDLDELSISQDGRWLALTTRQSDEIGPVLEMFFSSEAYLYDLQDRVFVPLNQNTMISGSALRGNGPSKTAILSSDGRFAVFASQADNLVAGDRNAQTDVFLLDRQTGLLEIVSVASDGEQGDGPSGANVSTLGNLGEKISISADGRFVAFISAAGNLATGTGIRCSAQGWYPCLLVLVRDRQERKTIALVPPLINAVYLYPTLSAGGQWLGLVYYDLECPRTPDCSVILTYNLKTSELAQVSTGKINQTSVSSSGWLDKRLIEEAGKRITSLAVMPGENLLAGGLDDGGVILWEIESGAPYLRIKGRETMVSALAFSPDGALLAVGWRDGHLAFYTMPGGELLTDLKTQTGSVLSLAFSPDGEMLAVGGMGLAWTYEVRQRTFSILDYSPYPGLYASRVIFSPDGNLVVHGLSDGTLWLRQSANGEPVAYLAGHESGGVSALAFSHDGLYLANGGSDGWVNIWQLTAIKPELFDFSRQITWQVERFLSLEHLVWIADLLFSPHDDSLLVATVNNGLRVWKLPQGDLLEGPFGSRWDSAAALVFSKDGKYLAAASYWGGIKIWEWFGASGNP